MSIKSIYEVSQEKGFVEVERSTVGITEEVHDILGVALSKRMPFYTDNNTGRRELLEGIAILENGFPCVIHKDVTHSLNLLRKSGENLHLSEMSVGGVIEVGRSESFERAVLEYNRVANEDVRVKFIFMF